MYTFGPKTGYEAWKEDEKKKSEVKKARKKAGLPETDFTEYRPVQYTNTGYQAKSDNPKKSSFEWEKSLLPDLSIKKYGRSNNDKFSNAVKEIAGKHADIDGFRKWLDAKEEGVQTKNSLTNDIVKSSIQKQNANFDRLKNPALTKKEEKKPAKPSLLNDFLTPFKRYKEGVQSIFDGDPTTNFTDSFKDAVNDAKSTDRSKVTQEATRGLTRIANSGTLGALNEAYKKTHGEQAPQFQNDNRSGGGKVADFAYDALGYLTPGMGAYKGVKAAGLGVKEGAQGLTKLRQLAQEGALTGAGLTGAEIGIREGLNGQDYSAKDNLKYLALGTGLGAVGDPLVHGAGQLLKGASNQVVKRALPSNEELAKRLSNALMTGAKSDLQTKKPSFDDFAEGLQSMKRIEPKPLADSPLMRFNESAATVERPREFEAITARNENVPIVRAPINGDIPFNPNDPLPNTVGHIGTKTKKEVGSFDALKNKAYIKTIDNLHTLNQFDKTVEKVTGTKLKPSESAYTLGLNSRGTDQISKQILTQNMVDKNGEVIGKSLKEIASQVPKGELKDFEDYLVNKHAITRQKRGEKVFPDEMQMNAEKSAAKVAEYEQSHPKFKDIADQYYEYNNQLGKTWLVDTGVLSEKQWDQYLEANPHYTPMNRMFKDVERPTFGNSAKKGFSNQSNPIKKAIGSQRKIVSPMESTIEHTAKYVKTAKRNEVMQTVIDNLQKDPEAFKGFAEIVPTKDTPQDIMETLKNDGVEGLLENFNTGFEQKPDLTKGNVLFGIKDGKKVHVKVHDPELLEALTNLQPQAQNVVIHAVGQLTRMMKTLTTGINPVFSLTRNIFRDIPTAYVDSKTTNNPITFAKDLVGAIVSVAKNDELYRSFKAVGGGHASPVSSDVNLLAQSKRSILPQKGIKPLLGKGIGALENLNNTVEAAPRLGEFKRLTKNDKSYDAKMKGLFEANDVTVNFNKFGNYAKEVDAVVPYLNAALQGIDKTLRVVKDNPIQSTIKGFTAVTIPSVLLYAINHNNKDYNQLSNYIKDNNFLIPNGDGTFTKVPKPRELGVMFGSDVERALKMWNNQDPKAFEDFSTTILDSFIPPKRTVLAPFQDIRANKNFMDIPIVSGDLKNLSPKYQYDSKTSEVSKKIGSLTNQSPKNLDYLIKSYGGIIGELGIPATTKDATIGNTLKQKVTADPVFSNDITNKFYEFKEKLDQAQSDFTKQGIKSPEMNNELRLEFGRASREIGKVRKEVKATQSDQSLTPKERQKQIRELQKRINEMAQQTLNDAR